MTLKIRHEEKEREILSIIEKNKVMEENYKKKLEVIVKIPNILPNQTLEAMSFILGLTCYYIITLNRGNFTTATQLVE